MDGIRPSVRVRARDADGGRVRARDADGGRVSVRVWLGDRHMVSEVGWC